MSRSSSPTWIGERGVASRLSRPIDKETSGYGQADHLFDAAKPVTQAPPPGVTRAHQQQQPAAVAEPVFCVFRARLPHRDVAQGHGAAPGREPIHTGTLCLLFEVRVPVRNRGGVTRKVTHRRIALGWASVGRPGAREARKRLEKEMLTRVPSPGRYETGGNGRSRLVPGRGLEPPRCYPLVPDTS